MAHQRRQLEQLREELPTNPTLLLPTDQDLGAPTKGLSGMLSKGDGGGSCAFISHLGSLGVLLGAVSAPLYTDIRSELVLRSSAELCEPGQCQEGAEGVGKEEAGGLKPVCAQRLRMTPLWGL